MTEPPRLLDEDDAFKRTILRSSELDVPSARSFKRAHALALGIASSTVASVGTAASGGAATAGAVLGSAGTLKAIAIWAGVGVLSGALVSGTAVSVLERKAPEQRSAPAAPRVAEREPARTPGAPAAGTPAPVAAPRAEADQPANEPANPSVKGRTGSAATSPDQASPVKVEGAQSPEPSAARYAPVPSDELAQELSMVDRARSALRGGDAAGALERVANYERAFKRPRFAPEASAIRIEALIAQGRRAEAARLARSFMAQHPGHPLTPRLREFVGEER